MIKWVVFILVVSCVAALECPAGCGYCENEHECIQCLDGFFMNKKTHLCLSCFKLCNTCNSYRQCTSCPTYYVLDSGNCIYNENRIDPILLSCIILIIILLIVIIILILKCIAHFKKNKEKIIEGNKIDDKYVTIKDDNEKIVADIDIRREENKGVQENKEMEADGARNIVEAFTGESQSLKRKI